MTIPYDSFLTDYWACSREYRQLMGQVSRVKGGVCVECLYYISPGVAAANRDKLAFVCEQDIEESGNVLKVYQGGGTYYFTEVTKV